MHERSELGKALLLAFGAGTLLAAASPGANAQRVEITGSSIRQIAAESALSVTVLRTDDLAKAGVSNAEQALSFVTSNQSAINTARSISNTNGGAASADLRGLGTARTLVLINGKRLVANSFDSGYASAVDLNTIPFGAVERIEVLNDGASAIYGSDAIAGVVNFITRREVQGLTLNASLSQPFASGGGEGYDIGATGGVGSFAEQGWNLFGGIGYRWQKALPASARSYARSGNVPGRGLALLSGATFPSSYVQGDHVFNPTLPGCRPPLSLPVNAGTSDASCGFDYSADADLVPKQTQLSAIAKGSFALDRDNTVSLEYLRGENDLSTRLGPTRLIMAGMPPASPFFPGGAGLAGVPGTPANTHPDFDPTKPLDTVLWRTTVAGKRETTIESRAERWLLDWSGSHAGWDYSLALLQSTSNIRNVFDNGYVNDAAITAGVTGVPLPDGRMAPWLNPFGAQTAAGAAFVQSQQISGVLQRSRGTLRGFKADASSAIHKLPAGPLTMALGVEHYKDSVAIANDARIAQASGSGLEGALDSSGSRHWTGVFVEFNLPLVKDLELNLALRHDDYSDFGGTTNPKASLRWTPAKELLLRGSVNTGFRAPSLYDVHAPTQTTFTASGSLNDPVLCPLGVVDTAAGGSASRDCGKDFQQKLGGNRQLQPESSKAWSLGLVLQPTASWLMSADYWSYVVDDTIDIVGEDAIFADPVKYADRFVRCSQVPSAQRGQYDNCGIGSGDPIAYIDNAKSNLGRYETRGVDLAASWRSAASDIGRFIVGWRGTYVLKYEYQLEPGGVFNNNLGTFFNGAPISRYRQVLNLGWQQGAWLLNLVNRYSRGYHDQNNVEPQFTNRVGAVSTWDLALTWSGWKNTVLSAGVSNVFDQDPPFSNQDTGPPTGYDYRYANPIGRALLLRAVYRF